MERWQEAEYLFDAAADLPQDERTRFLADACAGDAQLLREVEDLLAADGKGEEGILAAIEGEAQSLFGLERVVGSRIGAYRVVGEIGRGGMSTVYLAVRDDDQFQKQVAIKLIRYGMDTEDVLDRFRHERQILANLEHPYIARLLDGGAAPDGRPFLVMEYLQGEPLDVYCRDRGLDLRARCRLFLKICEAVSFAHSNLVVHRDLKPGNILVDAVGSPKLLDFGVAKLLDARTGSGLMATAVEMRPMTPDYTSPEQFRGETITTAADVYSLGAILYELLSGQRAHRLTGYGPRELERVICETEPPRPSECATSWRGQLRGDLDAIVAKAMRKEPALRYASVDHFAADLKRYLEGWPVQAHQGDISYRARKFLRRNRAAIAVGTLLAATLVAGATTSAMQARRADRERKVAEERLGQIVSLSNRSLSDVSALMERMPGAIEARTELIGSTLALLEKLAKDAGANWPLRIALAKTYLRMGVLQGGPGAANLRDLGGAIESFRAGLRLLEDSPGTSVERLPVWLDLRLKTSILLTARGEFAEAVKTLLDTLAVTGRLPASQLAGKEIAGNRADLFLALARATHSNLPQAREYATSYLNMIAALLEKDRDNSDLQYQLSVAHTELGFILWNLGGGDPEAALGHYEESMRLREQLVKEHPEDEMYRRVLLLGYEHYASMQGGELVRSMGRTEVARKYYLKALAIAESGGDQQNPAEEGQNGALLTRLGVLDVPPSQLAQSLATLRRAAGLLARDSASDGQLLTTAHEYMGRRLTAMGRYAEAVAEHGIALSMAERLLAKHPGDEAARQQIVDANVGITHAWTLAGDRERALESAQGLIRMAARDAYPATAIAQAYLSLGTAHRAFQEWAAAGVAAKEALRRDGDARTQREARALLAECQLKAVSDKVQE